MIFKKLASFISLLLCLAISFGTTAFAQSDIINLTQNEYNENESIINADTKNQIVLTNAKIQPTAIKTKAEIWFIFAFFRAGPSIESEILSFYWIGTEFTILKNTNNYCLVKDDDGNEGYIHRLLLREKNRSTAGNNGNLKLNRSYEHVFVNGTNADSSENPRVKAIYNGTGSVKWSTDRTDIIEVNSSTGLITGKKAGKANLIASVNSVNKVSIPVYCIYRWKSNWTGSAKTSAKIYAGNSTGTGELTTMPSGTKFYVYGDDGGSAGMAYGYATVNKIQYWGFVKIENISTKGTVSQYNNLGWSWPVKNIEYNYISSPYGTRITSPTKHKGIDISTNWDENQASIEGKEIVSAFKGTVDYVCEKDTLEWGYCVSITSDEKIIDPVSKKPFVAIYMHMQSKPKVTRGQKVSQGKELGNVGNTGNSIGPHLHFEVNNQTASIYELNGEEATQPGRSSYNDLINPIFFYIDDGIKYNETSEAEKYYYGTYWYGSE